MCGVQRCIVGYSGGIAPGPTYSEMKDYTESVLVEFDTRLIDYETILKKWKSMSSPYPTGRQYRTAVFYVNQEQQRIAHMICSALEHVDVEPATKFFMAETRHQDFLARL
jgi:peptide methionine sulfoxide reductase MsrA